MRGEDKRGEGNEAPKGRRRARGGVLFRGRPGELPGRGARCLAAERGERVQRDGDKERGGRRASKFTYARRGRWRRDRAGECRSARREDAKLMPAMCSTKRRLPGRGRVRPKRTGQCR
jgi:hypothetical protein